MIIIIILRLWLLLLLLYCNFNINNNISVSHFCIVIFSFFCFFLSKMANSSSCVQTGPATVQVVFYSLFSILLVYMQKFSSIFFLFFFSVFYQSCKLWSSLPSFHFCLSICFLMLFLNIFWSLVLFFW